MRTPTPAQICILLLTILALASSLSSYSRLAPPTVAASASLPAKSKTMTVKTATMPVESSDVLVPAATLNSNAPWLEVVQWLPYDTFSYGAGSTTFGLMYGTATTDTVTIQESVTNGTWAVQETFGLYTGPLTGEWWMTLDHSSLTITNHPTFITTNLTLPVMQPYRVDGDYNLGVFLRLVKTN
jgi:hypothetical protein